MRLTGKNGKRYTYHAVVEAVRIDGKPRQRLIYDMGKRATIAECIKAERKRLASIATLAGYAEADEKAGRKAQFFSSADVAVMRAHHEQQIEFLEDVEKRIHGK